MRSFQLSVVHVRDPEIGPMQKFSLRVWTALQADMSLEDFSVKTAHL